MDHRQAPVCSLKGRVMTQSVYSPRQLADPMPQPDIEALYRVIAARRDVRNGFQLSPVSDEVLTRVLTAAHQAPSVGLSQPWDFIIVRDQAMRERVRALARRQREVFASSLPTARALRFTDLKIEAIVDTPVNIAVTCDPTRGGRHVLGRHSQPQVAVYSCVCAVENLWLAARVEGLGVGWVSFFDERELAATLGLPSHLQVVAYLCVGHVDQFPPAPELAISGWARRRPLAWAVHDGRWGQRGLPGADPASLLADTLAVIRPADADAIAQAREWQKRITRTDGSPEAVEGLSVRLAGLAGSCPPPLPEPGVVTVFAADQGVDAQEVTPWAQKVTAQMVADFLAYGAAGSAITARAGVEICVVDVGVAADLPPASGLLPRKVRRGVSDMTSGPAMSPDEAQRAVETGIETARDLVAAGNRCLVTSDMGIPNVTASAAVIAVFTGAYAHEVTGRGAGIDDQAWARAVSVVRRALALHQPDPADPLAVLAAVGGLEHAALAGFMLGAAALGVPVVFDGVIACAAALVARALSPHAVDCLVAGHGTTEPGARRALKLLGLRPLLDVDASLGEGPGAVLALPIMASAARLLRDVAAFDAGADGVHDPLHQRGDLCATAWGDPRPAGAAADDAGQHRADADRVHRQRGRAARGDHRHLRCRPRQDRPRAGRLCDRAV
jgi:nicotinate-nucleotide--dimethylbenzimidazole phosphoribosyltransferase